MSRKIFLGLFWLVFVIYSVISGASLSATMSADLDLIVKLVVGEWSGINPLITAIFYMMGIFPLLYGALILFESAEQKISPYPFFFGSMGFGAFALLPYFALRQHRDYRGGGNFALSRGQSNSAWNGQKNLWLKILDSRVMAIIASVAMMTFLVWGITQGNWSDFITQWQTSQFVHVMSLDFCVLCCLFIAILDDDLERRSVTSKLLRKVALIPLFGALVYWCLRPQLPETEADTSSQSITS